MLRILLVDDDRPFVEIFKLNLKNYGHNIDAAYAVEEALEKLNSKAYDGVILDIMMPIEDLGILGLPEGEISEELDTGILLAKRIQRDYPILPIAFLTILAEPQVPQLNCLKNVIYIHKSEGIEEMIRRIRQHFG